MIHGTAIVDSGAVIGDGTKIWHWSHISSGSIIGKNCTIGQNVFVADGAIIGDGCKIQNNVSVYDGVVLKNDVFIGPSVVFTNVIDPRAFIDKKDMYRQTKICRGATIGANSTIICGVTIGEFAMIGAGSVVTKDVDKHQLWFGNPAEWRGNVSYRGDRTIFRRR